MIKITTLFKKNPENLGLVINEVDPQNEWVLKGEGIATQKFDGTAAIIIVNKLYKRYDVKKGRSVPDGAIPCQEPDEVTGHWPHWVKVDSDNPEDKYFWEAFRHMDLDYCTEGTYELCGEKINGNREKITGHELIKHGSVQFPIKDRSFENIRKVMECLDIEGIVFHHPDGRMCKIRKSDFGIKR